MLALATLLLYLLSCLDFTETNASAARREYQLLYGHVLAETLPPGKGSTPPSDVAVAVQIAEKAVLSRTSAATTGHHHAIQLQSFTKSRLYYTVDSRTPYMLEQRVVISDQIYLQRMHISLGFLYTVTIAATERESKPSLWHHLSITRDLNSEYHVFRHTFASHCQNTRHATCTNVSECPVLKQVDSGDDLLRDPTPYSERCSAAVRPEGCPAVPMEEEATLEGPLGDVFYHTLLTERQAHGNRCSGQEAERTSTNQRRCDATRRKGKLLPGHYRLPIRVATLNTWNLNSIEFEHYTDRLQRLGKMLSAQDLDILAVQEVRFEAGDHTHNEMADLAGFLPDYQYVFQPAMLYMERIDVRTEEGIAILSRHPILHSDYVLLSRNESDGEDSHQRICLHAEILTPSLGTVHIFATHLSLSQSSQEKTVVEVWQYVSQFSGCKLLMGDFNAEPHSPPIRFLRGEVPLAGVFTKGLRDSWVTATHKMADSDGFTYPALNGRPTKRIDYIFHQLLYSSDVTVINATLLDERDYCFSPCSDHHGVVATIG